MREYPGIKVTSCARVPEKGWKDVHRLNRTKPYGIESKCSDAISWNNNSGASAINIAYHFGAKRVVLLGFDMCLSDKKKKNWHDDYKREAKNPHIFERHLKGFDQIAEDAKALNLEIINCTEGSAITQFPIVPLKEVL